MGQQRGHEQVQKHLAAHVHSAHGFQDLDCRFHRHLRQAVRQAVQGRVCQELHVLLRGRGQSVPLPCQVPQQANNAQDLLQGGSVGLGGHAPRQWNPLVLRRVANEELLSSLQQGRGGVVGPRELMGRLGEGRHRLPGSCSIEALPLHGLVRHGTQRHVGCLIPPDMARHQLVPLGAFGRLVGCCEPQSLWQGNPPRFHWQRGHWQERLSPRPEQRKCARSNLRQAAFIMVEDVLLQFMHPFPALAAAGRCL
mmetsp:Transcript_41846/g.97442  ORF Transcript_41846/g.97442 Transcript_41846/m.97442 type:complete len:252 (+) Transcript_41846:274-1029(+)